MCINFIRRKATVKNGEKDEKAEKAGRECSQSNPKGRGEGEKIEQQQPRTHSLRRVYSMQKVSAGLLGRCQGRGNCQRGPESYRIAFLCISIKIAPLVTIMGRVASIKMCNSSGLLSLMMLVIGRFQGIFLWLSLMTLKLCMYLCAPRGSNFQKWLQAMSVQQWHFSNVSVPQKFVQHPTQKLAN